MKKSNFQILAGEWFVSADRVLEDAVLLEREGGHSDTICFHCHQAVEKYLKGFIVLNGLDIKDEFRTHDLSQLLQYCLKFNPSLKNLEENCEILNKYYIESRYPPSAPRDYPKQEVKQAISFAQEVQQRVLEASRRQ